MNIITRIDEASEKISKLRSVLSWDLYQELEFVMRAAKALPLNLKFKIGDRVRLTKTVEMTKDNYGWHGYEKELKVGQVGKISNIEAYNPKVSFYFIPEGLDTSFGFGEEWLETVVSEEEIASALKSLIEVIKK